MTAVPFVNGVAEFNRLRVDRNADELTLSFTTVPARFEAESSVQFSVVGLPDEAERKQVSFLLSVEGAESVQWGSEEVRGEVVRQMSVALDVDISRIQELVIQEMELVWAVGLSLYQLMHLEYMYLYLYWLLSWKSCNILLSLS